MPTASRNPARPLKWKILVCLLGATFIIVGACWVHGVSSSAADPLRLTNERVLFIAPRSDVCARCGIVKSTKRLDYSGRSFTYLTHFGWNWPWPPLFDPLGSIRSPNDRMSADRKTVVLSLPWADEKDKLVALGRYESQGGLLAPSIGAFVRVNEIYYVRINPLKG